MTPWDHLPLTDLSFQILLALASEPQHGYAILKTIAARTGERMEPDTGTLYTAIRRLKRDGLIETAPDGEPEGRRGRTYRLTALGTSVLRAESRRLADLVREARERDVLGEESWAWETSRD